MQSLELTYSERGNVILAVIHWANGRTNTLTPSNIRSSFGVSSIHFTVNGQTPAGTQPAAPAEPSVGSGVSINGVQTGAGTSGLYAVSEDGTVSGLEERPYVISGEGTVSPLETGGTTQEPIPVPPGQGGTVLVSGDSYLFEGGGLGHQVGMSQFGANAMARQGFVCDSIITFYFPDVQITHY